MDHLEGQVLEDKGEKLVPLGHLEKKDPLEPWADMGLRVRTVPME